MEPTDKSTTTIHFDYVEVAVSDQHSFWRNIVVPASKLTGIAKNMQPERTLYRSHWRYPLAFKKHVEATGSVKGYNGLRALDYIIVDIDMVNNAQRSNFLHQLNAWWDAYVLEWNLQSVILASFSGNGFHLYIHKQALSLEPSADLHKYVGATIESWWSQEVATHIKGFNYDPSMYRSAQVYRYPNSLNIKTGLHKVFFDPMNIDLQELAVAAKNKQHLLPKEILIRFFSNQQPDAVGFLDEYQPSEQQINELAVSPTDSPDNQHTPKADFPAVGHCFHAIMAKGKEAKTDHGRHAVALRLASFFHMQSMPYESAFVALHHWCNSALGDYDKQDTTRCLDAVYKDGYSFGCNDPILRSYCSNACRLHPNYTPKKQCETSLKEKPTGSAAQSSPN